MIDPKPTQEPRRIGGAPRRKAGAGIRAEEVCQIFNLKQNLDYSDILIKYAHKYLKLGWDLVAVNSLGEAALDLDFKEPEHIWSPKLTSLGLHGTQVNLGVRTGSPSRLVVLEVHREESLAPFNQRGNWGSGCIAEVGAHREQHYYLAPSWWRPPPSYFLESFQIMVFGEEGMVLAPPSLEPKVKANLRWLRPPWENPPTRPSRALCKFLQESAPALPEAPLPHFPPAPSWGELYPLISDCPPVLQALLAPAETPEAYYRNLLVASRQAGLTDPQVLLGLLWHAPRRDGGPPEKRWELCQRLVQEGSPEVSRPLPPGQEKPAVGDLPPSRPQAAGTTTASRQEEGSGAGFPGLPREAPSPSSGRRRPGPDWGSGNGHSSAGRPEAGEAASGPWLELLLLSQDNLVVDRRRYEAMIYELGKLGAWHDFLKREHRENRRLREKIEGQWHKELEYFRQLSSKNGKRGWLTW